MSDRDRPFDPFGRGDRTIIRPNPGGRRAAPSSPAAPPNPFAPPPDPYSGHPASPPYPGQAPPYPGQAPAPPYPAQPPPYSPPAAPAYPPPAADPYAAQRAQPQEAWATGGRYRPDDPGARALLQQRASLTVPSESPIMAAAGPLLLLLGRFRANIVRSPSVPLMEQVAQAIQDFEQEVRAIGFSPEQVRVAKYAVCATADDIVQNMPVEDRHIWTQYSMLSRFFGERTGGVRFFEELERAKSDPIVNYGILELMHACLALGFEGIHRTSAGGAAILQQIQRSLYDTLRRVRPKVTDEISPRWRGQSLAALPARYRIPFWAVASIAGVLLLAIYITLRTLLGGRAEIVAAALLGLFPGAEITIDRPVVVPPPPPPPPPRQITQLERIRAALATEIAAGKANADQTANEIIITVGNVVLFASGSADVLESFKPVAVKIADTLEKEPGFIKVVGHSDSTPIRTVRFPSNHALSVERAKAAAELLRPRLSKPDRLQVEGKGTDQPVASNQTPEGRARNRRVEIMIPRAD